MSGRGDLSPGLAEQGQRQTAMGVASATRPNSVLSQVGLSPLAQNASAPSMSSRFNAFTGSVMPNTMTGASENTAETALKLRFAGHAGV